MIKVDATKLVVALAAIAAAVVLSVFGDLETSAAVGVITGVMGYILGNGRSVAQGDRPGTMLTRTDVRSRADDTPPSAA